MRYVAETYLVDLWLRFGTLTIADLSNVTDSLAQTRHLQPALVGKLVRTSAIPKPEPHLLFDYYENIETDKISAAIGTSSILSLVRTSALIQLSADDREARFGLLNPDEKSHLYSTNLSGLILSSRKSYYDQSDQPDQQTMPDASLAQHRILIAPWRDPEMLGQAVLNLFRAANPPFVKDVESVFDEPRPKGRLKLHRAAVEGDLDAYPKSNRSGRDFDPVDSYGVTPLMLAAGHGHSEVAERLLILGASVSVRDARGRTPLHFAAQANDAESAEHLLEAGSDIEARDEIGRTPLHTAVDHGHIEVARVFLARGADANAHDEEYVSFPLHLAARGNHSTIVPILVQHGARLEEGNEARRTPLHVASAYGSIDTVRTLIRAGADVNQRDHNQESPLHRACFFQHLDVIEALIASGVDVNAADITGETPLHVSAAMNRELAAGLLMQHGAQIEARTHEGLTALDLALINMHRWPWEHNAEAAELLLRTGASIDPMRLPIQDRHVLWPHLTPPSVLMPSGDLDDEELFLKDGRAVYQTSTGEFDLPESVVEELKTNPQVAGDHQRMSLVTRESTSILHDAIDKDLDWLVAQLLQTGVSGTPSTHYYRPPMHLAVDLGNVPVLELLLDHGTDIEMPMQPALSALPSFRRLGRNTDAGWTPLDQAIDRRQVEAVSFLLDRGAEPPESLGKARARCLPIVREMGISGPSFKHPIEGGGYLGFIEETDAIVELFERRGSPLLTEEDKVELEDARQRNRRIESRTRGRRRKN